jgi:hypothetical protein
MVIVRQARQYPRNLARALLCQRLGVAVMFRKSVVNLRALEV